MVHRRNDVLKQNCQRPAERAPSANQRISCLPCYTQFTRRNRYLICQLSNRFQNFRIFSRNLYKFRYTIVCTSQHQRSMSPHFESFGCSLEKREREREREQTVIPCIYSILYIQVSFENVYTNITNFSIKLAGTLK